MPHQFVSPTCIYFAAAAFGFISVCLSLHGFEQQNAPPKNAPPYVYRTFTLPAKDPQLNEKWLELTGEGWEIVPLLGTQMPVFRRTRQPDGTKLVPELLAPLQGKWKLLSISENGMLRWPQPTKDKAPSDNSPLTLTFSGNRFAVVGKAPQQEGTIQFLAKSKENLLVDLLIDKDHSPANRWFTVRSLVKVVVDGKEKKENLYLCSGGYDSDRPTNFPSSANGSSQMPAFSIWTRP